MASALSIEPVDATLGAVVTDVDLRGLDQAPWQAVEAAFNEYAVLIFPGQHLTPEEQRSFATRFGPISTPEPAGSSRSKVKLPRSEQDHGAFNVANMSQDGAVLSDANDTWVQTLAGNFEWHTDSSFLPVSAKASMLTAHAVPSAAGETEWCDMRAAYDALSADMKDRVGRLSAYHSFGYAQSRFLGDGTPRSTFKVGAPLRPLVKTHSTTGRRALYVGRHAFGIPGLSDEESVELLDWLNDFACQSDRIYSHHWQVGDLVVWDNRRVLHRGRPWDFRELRHLVHSRVAGDPVSEGAEVIG